MLVYEYIPNKSLDHFLFGMDLFNSSITAYEYIPLPNKGLITYISTYDVPFYLIELQLLWKWLIVCINEKFIIPSYCC